MSNLGPEGEHPQIPEEESKKSGIDISMENPEEMLESVKKGSSGEVGRTLLQWPAESLEVELISSRGEFDFLSSFNFNTHDQNNNILMGEPYIRQQELISSNINNLISLFKGWGFNVEERGGIHFINRENENYLLGNLEEEQAEPGIFFSTGYKPGDFEPEKVSPSLKVESFREEAERYLALLKTISDSLHQSLGINSPKELVLKSPKEAIPIDGRTSTNGKELPRELLGKIEIEKPNVTFKEIGGNEKAKREIEGLSFALKNPELY